MSGKADSASAGSSAVGAAGTTATGSAVTAPNAANAAGAANTPAQTGGNTPTAAGNTPTGNPAGASVSTPAADSPLRRPGVVLACNEFATLNATRLARARSFFGQHPAYFEIETDVLEEGVSLLVYTPPVENQAAAQKKLADFRRQGFEDIAIISEGPQRLGMSFGTFKHEAAARAMVDNLTNRGVRNLRIAERDASRTLLRYRYPGGDNGLPRDLRVRLTALAAEIGQTPRACTAARPAVR